MGCAPPGTRHGERFAGVNVAGYSHADALHLPYTFLAHRFLSSRICPDSGALLLVQCRFLERGICPSNAHKLLGFPIVLLWPHADEDVQTRQGHAILSKGLVVY